MFEYRFTTNSMNETQDIANKLSNQLLAGDVVALVGDLGTGKTTFSQGIANAMGIDGYVSSPTFTYINEYPGDDLRLIHIDAYRIEKSEDLIKMGLSDYFEDSVILVEWANLVPDAIPEDAITLLFTAGEDPNNRTIQLSSYRKLKL